jgi:hypothetical protein
MHEAVCRTSRAYSFHSGRKVLIKTRQLVFVLYFFFFFFFFFYWAPVTSAPGSTAAMKAYFTSLALEVLACTARSPHAYEARDL